MANINSISNAQALPTTAKQTTTSSPKSEETQEIALSEALIYEKDTAKETAKNTGYKPDLEKLKSMKIESEQRLIDLLLKTTKDGFIKQLGGLRGVLQKALKGEKTEDIKFTQEDLDQAVIDVAPGGYWSPESTSDRFLEFAKALSGGDPSKADLLLDGFKKGYDAATKAWGGELPEISKKTYDLTLEKFEAWSSSKA